MDLGPIKILKRREYESFSLQGVFKCIRKAQNNTDTKHPRTEL